MTSNVPNLDGMPHDDLTQFWMRHQAGRKARELFPEGGKGTVRATWDLANYASNLHAVQSCRLRGDIPTALYYEDICQRIYDKLPDFARW